ncbi:LOW QUALITY PROTEIN: protein Njmu-R1-like [Physeter macrocephalus]|uniref:LOW QUALITY PROTEIN: protein Njmu-R1-like n=1 Tax=Physeter macrocephalus TaxID=9755 RepID=A0A9W2X0C4_PHYMC|nr:LOW QUALITY PROTEIN: protein Njmu-R1-like [Physeter catodon]
MLPSLQESLDGDEKALESSEEGGPTEEPRLKPLPSSRYCVYSYRGSRLAQRRAGGDGGSPSGTDAETPSGDDFSLSLADTNLPSEVEPELHSFIAKRLSKRAVFEGLGNVACVELRTPGYRVSCYYCLFHKKNCFPKQQQRTPNITLEYTVCFLGGSEKGLELFRLELDKHIQGLKNDMNREETGGENHIQSYPSSCFEDVICPIQRVVRLFQKKLTFLLLAALSYTPIEVEESDEKAKRDIHRFLSVASLQGLIHEGTVTSLCVATKERRASVFSDCSSSRTQFHGAGSNWPCEDGMQPFLNGADGGNPFLFRQVLENFKLKALQDTDNLKRLIWQAEMNHYALFQCFMFLKNCGSGDIFLEIVKVEHEELPKAKSVVAILKGSVKEAPAQSF